MPRCKRIVVDPKMLLQLLKKAAKSDCTYKVSGIALDKKGDVLGCMVNSHSQWDVVKKEDSIGRAGTARHVERRLISRYGSNIKSIIICRVGHSGDLRPIDPCPTCKAVAEKMGIKVYTIR